MDFLDLTSYSPTSEAVPYADLFDKAYLADSYLPDYSFNGHETDLFPDPICFPPNPTFWRPTPQSPNNPSDSPPSASTTTTTTTTSTWPAPFGSAGALPTAFARPQDIRLSTSPCLSPQSLTRRSPSSSTISDHSSEADAASSAPARPPPRKRGRPRLYRQTTGSSDGAASEKAAYPQRLPHNQVERKYREGLNMELERLRRAVPTLPQGDVGATMGSAKPSKAMVLAAAIDYIKKVERERDESLFELERLRGGKSSSRGSISSM